MMIVGTIYLSVLDSTIDAPPSFKPAKKYSDISGLLVCTIILTLIYADRIRMMSWVCFFIYLFVET
jgi:hypothetical protein